MKKQTSVLIVGAGPVGLSAALELGFRGVPCLVVERRARVGGRSRVTGISPWTMELFRYWGIDHEIRSASLPFDDTGPVAWKRTLAGETLARIRPEPRGLGAQGPSGTEVGPTVFCPSDAVESVLLAAIARCPSVEVHFSTELRGFTNTEDGVTAQLARGGGEPDVVRADYLLACDGLGSDVRKMLRIPLDGVRLGVDLVTIDFEADLRTWTGERPYAMYWIINSASCGCLVPRSDGRRWLYTVFRRADVGELTAEWCSSVVRGAVGVPELTPEIVGAQPRRMKIGVACRLRDQRVFLAGDSAHRFLPMVGPGVNLGIHDAYDFAWKVTAVRAGWAGPILLDSYDVERRAIAKRMLELTFEYVQLMAQTGVSADIYDFAMALEEEGEDAAALRDRVRSVANTLRGHWGG